MSISLAILYGVIQGLTEFLPVSSSGHLVLSNKIFGTSADFVFFSVLLHVATLLAVVIVLWKDIKFLFAHPFSRPAKLLYVATIPTIIIVLCFKGFFENAFGGSLLPVCFVFTAVLLAVTQTLGTKAIVSPKKITYKTSLMVGLMQGLTVLPGISRSGSTICTAVLCGADKQQASRFSFLLSIPIILASIGYELLDVIINQKPFFDVGVLPTLLAFLSAFVVGLLCVKFMLTVFQKINLWWFSAYLIIIAGVSFFVV